MIAGGHGIDLSQELHDLSQPLTRLQWRLELGQRGASELELRETIAGALADADDLMRWIRQMRAKTETQSELAGRVA